MPTARKPRIKKSSNAFKGSSFEGLVRKFLNEGNRASDGRITHQHKPQITLQNGEHFFPDFIVKAESPIEIRHFYIECQNRKRSKKEILHKIQHVRTKHHAKTFIYVYAQNLGAELARSFESEGIVARNLEQFRFWILELAGSINFRLSDMATIRTGKSSVLPPAKEFLTAFHSHPNGQKAIDEFLKGTK